MGSEMCIRDRPCAGSTLADIANITGGTCTDVQDIDTLTAVIESTGGVPPTGIANVSLSINGGAATDVAVDNLGNGRELLQHQNWPVVLIHWKRLPLLKTELPSLQILLLTPSTAA